MPTMKFNDRYKHKKAREIKPTIIKCATCNKILTGEAYRKWFGNGYKYFCIQDAIEIEDTHAINLENTK